MRFWLIRGKDGKVYITAKNEKPTRDYNRSTGWVIGFPGTGNIDNEIQMCSMFCYLYEEVREVLDRVPFPESYEDDPVEIEIDLKIRWYG